MVEHTLDVPEEIVDLSAMQPHPRNYQEHPDAQLQHIEASIKTHGIYRNIVLADDGTILAGHGVVAAAARAGRTSIPARRMPYGPDDPRAIQLLVADNEIARLAIRDDMAISELLKSVRDESATVENSLLGTGYDDESALELISSIVDEPTADVPSDNDDSEDEAAVEQLISRAPEFQEKWNVKHGQWWQLGRHKVYCGDSRDVADSFKCDLLFTDPPYGIGVLSKSGGTIGGPKPFTGMNQVIRVREYEPVHGDGVDFDPDWLLPLGRDSIIWGANAFASRLPDRYSWLVWDKQVPPHLTFSQCELAWHTFGKSIRLFIWKWSGVQRKGERAIECKHRVHPTQKPVGLYRQILQHYIKSERITIADPYLGSGTTLLACELSNHTCIAGEYEPMYVATTLERWSNLTGNTPTLMDDTPNV